MLNQAGPENLAGKILWDTTNPLDFSRGMPPSLFVGTTDSGGEQVQRFGTHLAEGEGDEGAVGGAIVDNQRMERWFQPEHMAEDLPDVLLLVVGRYDDQPLGHALEMSRRR